MRLIDADRLRINLYHNKKVVVNDDLVKCIDDTETSYDIDKVVKELEENASRYTKKYITPYGNNGYRDTKAISIHKAIEIIKHGGVSDDVCEWEKDEHSENDNPAEWIICPHKPKRIFSKDIKYCPYCGKKIKVVE